jgi:ribose 5-phosphate isomerase A
MGTRRGGALHVRDTQVSSDDHKRAAAHAALDELPSEGIVGLGTGSTVRFFLQAIAGKHIVCVSTSEQTRAEATALGIHLLDDDGPWHIAVTFDGADEVDPALDMIKGGGGAHTREKIVNYASAKNVIMIDDSKLSRRLGERHPIPIEVLAFAHKTTSEHLARFGRAVQRAARTDAGNVIYELHVDSISNARELEAELRAIPGVVETGLFLGRADVVLIGSSQGVERRVRS